MIGEAAAGVRPRHDHHALVVQHPDGLHDLVIRAAIGGVVAGRGGVDPRRLHAPLRPDRHVADIVHRTFRHLAVAVGEQVFVNAERDVDRHFPLDHQVDRVLHLGTVQVEPGKALKRGQAEQRARVLGRLDHPSQHELVDVGHLVEARADHLVGVRKGWDVPGDLESQAVRFLHHRRHPVGIHAVIGLDAPITPRRIPARGVDCLRLAVHQDAVIGAERALALDKAGADDAGAGNDAAVDPVDQFVEHGIVVAHVAHRRDAGDQVEEGTFLAGMGMHFIHAGDQRAAAAVDHDFALGRRAVDRFDRRDPVAPDDDGNRRRQSLGPGIEDPDVADADRPVIAVRDLLLDVDEAVGRPLGGKRLQPPGLSFIAGAHDHETRAYGCEHFAVRVQQDRVGRCVDASQIVARDLERAAIAAHVQRLPLGQPQRAFRQRGEGGSARLQDRAGIEACRPGAAALRDIEGAVLGGGAALAC